MFFEIRSVFEALCIMNTPDMAPVDIVIITKPKIHVKSLRFDPTVKIRAYAPVL